MVNGTFIKYCNVQSAKLFSSLSNQYCHVMAIVERLIKALSNDIWIMIVHCALLLEYWYGWLLPCLKFTNAHTQLMIVSSGHLNCTVMWKLAFYLLGSALWIFQNVNFNPILSDPDLIPNSSFVNAQWWNMWSLAFELVCTTVYYNAWLRRLQLYPRYVGHTL